jgi:hypothetical protein
MVAIGSIHLGKGLRSRDAVLYRRNHTDEVAVCKLIFFVEGMPSCGLPMQPSLTQMSL